MGFFGITVLQRKEKSLRVSFAEALSFFDIIRISKDDTLIQSHLLSSFRKTYRFQRFVVEPEQMLHAIPKLN